jgi:phage gpG-like protein
VTDTKFVKGADRLLQRLATIRARTAFTLDAATQDVGELLLKRTKERFIRQVDPDGIKWAALAPATVTRKKYPPTKNEFRNSILRSTGLLYDSIALIRDNSTRFLASNTGAGVRIGVNNPKAARYGIFHQQSSGRSVSTRNGGVLPQRRFLGIGRLDVKAADSLFRNRLKKLIEGAV